MQYGSPPCRTHPHVIRPNTDRVRQQLHEFGGLLAADLQVVAHPANRSPTGGSPMDPEPNAPVTEDMKVEAYGTVTYPGDTEPTYDKAD